MQEQDQSGVHHHGADGSGAVTVALDESGCGVRVRVHQGWRRGGPEFLGQAVVAALRAATIARLQARVSSGADVTARSETWAPVPLAGSLSEQLLTVSRAWRDLAEFRLRVGELSRSPAVSGDAGDRVRVVTQLGAVVGVRFDPEWITHAADTDIAARTGAALSAASADLASMPARILQGCPDLTAVVSAAPTPLPFDLTAPDRDGDR